MSAAPVASKSASDPAADLLPARMLNEFVYCPRLFYYEHVEGVFLHSADTKKGAAEHTRVDAGKGALPPAAEEKPEELKAEKLNENDAVDQEQEEGKGAQSIENRKSEIVNETIHARSVMLGSELLGVVAKLDLVEVKLEPSQISGLKSQMRESVARAVCPVEYKTGAPREGSDGRELWDADRMQLGLQILLLRENGYVCTEGVVYYRARKSAAPLKRRHVAPCRIVTGNAVDGLRIRGSPRSSERGAD